MNTIRGTIRMIWNMRRLLDKIRQIGDADMSLWNAPI